MTKKLMIIESPNKIKTIANYLKDDNFTLLATYGHLRDLSKFGMGFSADLDPIWVKIRRPNVKKTKTTAIKGTKATKSPDIIKTIQAAATIADEIYLSTDPDREGEAIAWHVWNLLDEQSQKKCARVVFNEITQPAITAALNHPQEINQAQVDSYLARRILDREFGFKLSKFVRTYYQGYSAGRVQSVALKFLVDREKEIQAFIPQSWYNLEVELLVNDQVLASKLHLKQLASEFSHFPLNLELKNGQINFINEADALAVKAALAPEFTLKEIHQPTKEHIKPKAPLKTSTLQQEGISRFKLAARKVEAIAQKLYEGVLVNGQMVSLITYPRTDQTNLSEVFLAQAEAYITTNYGANYLNSNKKPAKKNPKKTPLVQGAHEGIRPTDLTLTPELLKAHLPKAEWLIYSLIWAHALGSIMTPSCYQLQYFDFVNRDCLFNTYLRTQLFDGFEKLYWQYDLLTKPAIPSTQFNSLVLNESYCANEVLCVKHDKKPPSRYNEASLIQALEKEGIGRPSTYASITNSVLNRDYAHLQNKALVPTEKGINICEGLVSAFGDIISFSYTREMEVGLDEIANNNLAWKQFLIPKFAAFNDQLNQLQTQLPKKEPEKMERNCPLCNHPLIMRESFKFKRASKFVGCSNYPKCKYTESLEPKNPIIELPFSCPDCQSSLRKRISRYNKPFVGCSNYPQCKWIMDWKKFCEQHQLDPEAEIGTIVPNNS